MPRPLHALGMLSMKTMQHSLHRGLLVFLFFSACFSARATPPRELVLTEAEWITPNIIRIPFTLTGTLITVRARVDSVEGNFFFDTGAAGLLLNARHFGARGVLAASDGGGVTGAVRVMGAVALDTFRLDNLLATELQAELIDLTHIERVKKTDLVGLVGYSVFRDYEVLFDYAASILLLVRTDDSGTPLDELPGWEYRPLGGASLKVSGHIALVWLEFGPKKGKWFGLDSGAEQNLLSVNAGKKFLKEHFEILRRVKLRGAGRTGIEVLSGTLQHAHIDTFALKPMATILTNLREINAAYETRMDGVLGYEFLSQRPVGINYKKRRITFYSSVRP